MAILIKRDIQIVPKDLVQLIPLTFCLHLVHIIVLATIQFIHIFLELHLFRFAKNVVIIFSYLKPSGRQAKRRNINNTLASILIK